MGASKRNQCKLVTMFTLNFGFFLVELVVGYLTHSMALVADSFHMLSDVAALVVAYFAVKMSPKKWSKNTYGWARAEVLGALVNSVFLIALCFSIVVESIQRIVEPRNLKDPQLILIVGSIGLVMNLVGLCMFRDHGHSHGHGHSHDCGVIPLEGRRSTLTHSNRLTRMVSNVEAAADVGDNSEPHSNTEFHLSSGDAEGNATVRVKLPKKGAVVTINMDADLMVEPDVKSNSIRFKTKHDGNKNKVGGGAAQMNIRGVFLHLLADALGSVIVIVSALVVEYTDWEYEQYIDPCLSIFMVILILISVYPLLVESALILLQSVPDHIDMEELEKKLLKQIDGVMGVHELHVWQLAGDRIIATAHIKCRTLQEYFYIAEKVKAVFHNEGIHSTTIQPEFLQQSPDLINKGQVECYLSCSALSTAVNCSANTCCPATATPSNGNGQEQGP